LTYGLNEDQLEEIALHVGEVLVNVGEDFAREGILETPMRSAKAWAELTRGLREDPSEFFKVFESNGYDEMVIVKDISFVSLCEHHLLPFMGQCHIGYIPNGKVLGLSKFARIVQHCAAKPQIQEGLTMEIANLIEQHLEPLGVTVVMEAAHTCMAIRGVKAAGSTTVTSAVKGVFKDPKKGARAEFLQLIERRGS
jgi:GTP cyclohydrolase I